MSGTHAAADVFVSLLLLHVAALHILKEREEVGRAAPVNQTLYKKG